MNLEKLGQPIAAKSIEEHEDALEEKMTEIRLEYVDRIFSKKIPPLEKKIKINEDEEIDLPVDDFIFLLSRYTSVLTDLMSYHIAQKKDEGIKWEDDMYDPAQEEFISKIEEFHNKDKENWISKTMELLDEERKNTKTKISVWNAASIIRERAEHEDYQWKEEHGRAGLINFDVDNGYQYWFKGSEIPIPIKKSDTCISIHLEPLFKKTLNNADTNLFSSGSLEKLAVQIVEKFPETKAIIAESWLMDTPIAQRIGFKIYKRENYSRHGSFWQQFINQAGQIDNERVKKFLETGQAPYRIALGVIMTEDFLKKYLPKEQKGKIILKELKPDFESEKEEEENRLRKIKTEWNNITEKDIDDIIANCPIHKGFFETEFGRSYLEKLKNCKKEGKNINETIEELEFDFKYNDQLDRFLKGVKFINKEVIIE